MAQAARADAAKGQGVAGAAYPARMGSGETMNVEGLGVLAPRAEVVAIPSRMFHWLSSLADERTNRNRYIASSDAWKIGMTTSPVLKGLCGEWGVQQYLQNSGINCHWNPLAQSGGDDGSDLTFKGCRIQVKTGVPWIRRFDSRKTMLALDCDVYVFCELKNSTVSIMGWVFKEQLKTLGKRMPQGHRNIEVERVDMEPAHRLSTYLESL